MAFGVIFLAGHSRQSQAGKMAPSCPLGQPIAACDLVHLACLRSQLYNKPRLLPKCKVKMAGYWPSSFFECLWTETELRSINMQRKKEQGQCPAILTAKAWSIKDLLVGFQGNFSCGTWWVVLSRQAHSILLVQVANHSAQYTSLAQAVCFPIVDCVHDILWSGEFLFYPS